MRPVLVSACLLGEAVRYDGGSKPLDSPCLARWRAEGRVRPVCPEALGGLPIPRPPAELQADGRVRDRAGVDRTEAFERGASRVLDLAEGAALALLKEGSPSCGSRRIHDGSFRGLRIPGEGRAAAALARAGIPVFGEDRMTVAEAWLARVEQGGPVLLELRLAEGVALCLAGLLAPGDQPGPRLAALASRGARDPEAWRAGLGASEVRWVPAEPPGPRGLGASLALDGGRGAVLDLAFG